MNLVFKGQNLQIFLCLLKKKQQIFRDKILQVLMDLYDMLLQSLVFLSYRKHCSNIDSAQSITCRITHI
jgi:hypothetical protein